MSPFSGLRRLGLAGIVNRCRVAVADLGDWLGSLSLSRDHHIPLQPWRFAVLGRSSRVAKLVPSSKRVPAPRVALYEKEGGVHGRRPPTSIRIVARRLYHVRNAIVLRGHVILKKTRWGVRVPLHSFYARRKRWHLALRKKSGDVWVGGSLKRRATTRIEGPVLVADSPDYAYGHVLLEILLRVPYLDHCPPGTRILTNAPMTRDYLAMFGALGVGPERIVQATGPVVCDDVYFGDNLVDIYRFVTPTAWDCFARMKRLGDGSTTQTYERIYVTRRGVGKRPLVNEAVIEDVFRSFGFTVLAPETLPIEDQIRIFSEARMIAGPRGSGLHNIVFSAPDAKLLLLTFPDFLLPIDTVLMREDDTLGYVFGERQDWKKGESRYLSKWTIDPALVERAIRSHFGL